MVGTLSEAFKNMENGLYDYTENGKCTGCGACCSTLLPVSGKKIKEIRRYIKKNHIQEQQHNYPVKNLGFDLTCPFLNGSKRNNKCEIYPVRPEICRSFMCNDPHGARQNKKLLHKKYKPVDMRELFFGDDRT